MCVDLSEVRGTARPIIRILAALVVVLAWVTPVVAGTPRWFMGQPAFSNGGRSASWHNNHPLYFTDPGDLSSSVNHAAADAIVAAAAGVWNVPQASLVIAKGGELNEHVSGGNVYVGTSGPVFPSDVMSSNAAAVPIAVIYDSDGSVTDLLLGSGASDPSGCLQNAVTSTVDLLQTNGDIQHAIVILNGRCTGTAPQQQLQMQYQLERAIGRILGLGWSQLNDNVFTGPSATAQQALYWPIMHPIDIVCGTYTYLCLPQPFQIRPDDLSTLVMMYPVAPNNVPAGKEYSLLHGMSFLGYINFPSGQGMQGVNIVERRAPGGKYVNPWQEVSSVSGYQFQQFNGNPVIGAYAGAQSEGDPEESDHEGYFYIARIPITGSGDTPWDIIYLSSEAINPLYTGAYSIGPTVAQTIAPSGSTVTIIDAVQGPEDQVIRNFTSVNSASDCDTRQDGTEASPAAVIPGGWWTGRLCAYQHTAWSMFAVKAARSFTLEVTALDESNRATTAKAIPQVGLWSLSDGLGQLPTVAAATNPFNSISLGMTTLTVPTTKAQELRMAIADQRGDGRPDFAYQARLLYADSVVPSRLPSGGGSIAITGMGFRAGNKVTIGGIVAQVASWSATQIVAIAPTLSAVQATGSTASADVVVTDLTTGGTTVMSGALVYNGTVSDTLRVITAPSGSVPVGTIAPAGFTVQLLAGDGVTPIVGAPITFTNSSQNALLGVCNAANCSVTTDGSGYASTSVIPQATGNIAVTATAAGGASQSISFTAVAVTQAMVAMRPVEYVAANTPVIWMPQVDLVQNGVAAGNTAVNWSATSASASSAQSMTNTSGVAQVVATTIALGSGGQATVQACAWQSICATMLAKTVDASVLQLQLVSGGGQSIGVGAALAPVTLRVTDDANDPVAGATVQIHQSATGEQSCPSTGRCPTPPNYGTTQSQVVSDEDGLVTLQPMQAAGVSEVVNVVAAVGTRGFLSLSLQVGP